MRVVKKARQKGVGRRLMEAVLLAMASHHSGVFVFTNRANTQADEFCRLAGGEERNGDDVLFENTTILVLLVPPVFFEVKPTPEKIGRLSKLSSLGCAQAA